MTASTIEVPWSRMKKKMPDDEDALDDLGREALEPTASECKE